MSDSKKNEFYADGKRIVRTFYHLCDRKACEECIYPKCSNTTNSEHAISNESSNTNDKKDYVILSTGLFEVDKAEMLKMKETKSETSTTEV